MARRGKCRRRDCPSKVGPARPDAFCSEVCRVLSRAMTAARHNQAKRQEVGKDATIWDVSLSELDNVARAVSDWRWALAAIAEEREQQEQDAERGLHGQDVPQQEAEAEQDGQAVGPA